MTEQKPILLWFRRDLRLADNPMLAEAAATGRPLIPVFIDDALTGALGAAARWRLGRGLDCFARALAERGLPLVLRRGAVIEVLAALCDETGADTVWWARLYDRDTRKRDTAVKSSLRARGIAARSFPGHLLFEPWSVETGNAAPYRVYSPFWKAVRGRDPGAPLPVPARLCPPAAAPRSAALADWNMGRAMDRGAAVVGAYACIGEAAARDRLDRFVGQRIARYKDRRDYPGENATSGLSENLTLGEISPRVIWQAAQRAMAEGAAGAEHFVKELVWREFAWHIFYHSPNMDRENWRSAWDGFPWATEGDSDAVMRWKQGRTGVPLVDAAMREMYVTGTMHNRTRMIVASYLTKHMLVHWKVGLDWFAECLIDWDPAANALGWQWVAGSGPDAAPYFRVFNPFLQAERFDPDGSYRRRFIAEGQHSPGPEARAFFDAIPRAWGLERDARYPDPIVSHVTGRARALDAYERHRSVA